ncbi:hypothetical protein SPOG_04464 [Schizosaccharomyces cryophilus OY26]|uniref:Up-regulated during septation protein 1 domain-containing protein n=1 Tax=Schizosaccharomyces cryophilus (strain OY26 / ATCC MYA-4695 / CBS 11777 / NBRC 106824 / NRRL Y48691) TaxID=653667 RepID=S9VSR7_SCHCR|nr:uncharacterized protein SPOG_04464 [Schizosaccharomyces cryophilus OY26]EPY49180.1 hypothetical protein SPOG_04464 [Schizosaccharomyces cryophilus OY26]
MEMSGGTCITTEKYEPELKEKYGNPEPPSSGVLLTTQVFNPFNPNFKYNRREKQHSGSQPLPNDMQDLLVSSAVKDASDFECLNGKEVEEIKRKIKIFQGNLDVSVKKLAVEAKIREAAKNLMLAQTKEKKGKHKQSTIEHYEQCSRKVRELSSKIWVIERKLSELYFFLLKHMVAVCIREIKKQPRNGEQQSDSNAVSQENEDDETKKEIEEEEVMNHEEIQQLVERMGWMLETVHSMGSSVHEPSVVNVVDMTAGERLLEQVRHLEILLKGMHERKLEEEADAKDIAPRSILNFWKALNRLFQQENEHKDLQVDSSHELEQVQMHLKPNFDIESFSFLLNHLLTKYQRVRQLYSTNQELLEFTKGENVKKIDELRKVVEAQSEQVKSLQGELGKAEHNSNESIKENTVPESNDPSDVMTKNNKQMPSFEIRDLHSQCSLLYGEKYEMQQASLLLESKINELENEKKANKLIEKDLLAQISQLKLKYEQQRESNEFSKKLINNLRDELTAMQAELSVVKAMNTQSGVTSEALDGEKQEAIQKHMDVLTKENELLHSRVNTLELEKEHQEKDRDAVNNLTLKQLQVEELFANLNSHKKMDFGLIDFGSPESKVEEGKRVDDSQLIHEEAAVDLISASEKPIDEENNEHKNEETLEVEMKSQEIMSQHSLSSKDASEEEENIRSASDKRIEPEVAKDVQ